MSLTECGIVVSVVFLSDGSIENVIMGFPDMYGRMMGKRFDADFFLDSAAADGTHACDYLLASDMEMVPIPVSRQAHLHCMLSLHSCAGGVAGAADACSRTSAFGRD